MRIVDTRSHSAAPVSVVDDGLILALWRQKLDTVDIAKHLGRNEWEVANRLLHLREQAR
ncbi:hypothetical protein [Bradyrhizobium sp. SZCCHNR3015]|uniref:hypothetical protein n=1 Tax=Bradyrhizobium sp. SZCCHNR3015 TaxID=3057395 RepID=UPI002915F5A4|nr:hypothetical protein [Bradyrhizobium sp. SZCCHNR3015]